MQSAIAFSLAGSGYNGGTILPGVIPVLGPWIVAGTCSNGNNDFGCTGQGSGVLLFWLVFDGIQQAAGLSMLIAGIAAKETVLAPERRQGGQDPLPARAHDLRPQERRPGARRDDVKIRG